MSKKEKKARVVQLSSGDIEGMVQKAIDDLLERGVLVRTGDGYDLSDREKKRRAEMERREKGSRRETENGSAGTGEDGKR